MTTTMTAAPSPEGEPRRRLWDIHATADRLGVTVRHVRRLVTERRIPHRKWGNTLRFDPDEIEAWIDQTRRPPVA